MRDVLSFCTCARRGFILRFEARDATSGEWVDGLVARYAAAKDREIIAGLMGNLATPPPVLELALRATPDDVEAVARMEGRELILTNDAAAPLRGARRATVPETFALVARWFLGEGRHGCAYPLVDAFWSPRGRFIALTVDDPDPETLVDLPAVPGVFVACVEGPAGPFLINEMSKRLRGWSERTGGHAGVAWYLADRPRTTLQVALMVEEGAGPPLV